MSFDSKQVQSESKSPGNKVGRKLPFFQPKLQFGRTGDRYEQEADAMAEKVVNATPKNSDPFFSPVVTQISRKKKGEWDDNIFQKSEEGSEAIEELEESGVEALQRPADNSELEKLKEKAIQKQTEFTEETSDEPEEWEEPSESLVQQKSENDTAEPEDLEDIIQKQSEENFEDEEVKTDSDVLQAKSEAPTQPSVDFETALNNSKGGGSPMEAGLKSQMESGFGADFSNVRMHTGSQAVQMNKDIGAQAFTHGNDIYFNEGKYNPASKTGQHLVAHELTHTIQQGSALQTKMIQRKDESDTVSGAGNVNNVAETSDIYTFIDTERGGKYTVDTVSKEVTLPTISVPPFKAGFGSSSAFTLPNSVVRVGGHREAFEEAVINGAGFTSKFEEKVRREKAAQLDGDSGAKVYFMVLKGGNAVKKGESVANDGVIFGNADAIKQRIARPYWDKDGKYMPHDVDHKHELQLGGGELDLDNLWMLESSANRSSGSLINQEINKRINTAIAGTRDHLNSPPKFETVKGSYKLNVAGGVTADRNMTLGRNANANQNWSLDELKSGDHLGGLKFLNESEITAAGLQGRRDQLIMYTGVLGGRAIRVPWDTHAQTIGRKDGLDIWFGKAGGANLKMETVIYKSVSPEGGSGTLICTAFPNPGSKIDTKENLAFNIVPATGVQYGGVISRPSIKDAIANALEFKLMSPIILTDADLNPDSGLVASGYIEPTIPLISDSKVNIDINGDEVWLSKLFNTGDFNFPPPFRIDNTNLEVFASTHGIGINGQVDFSLDKVGKGYIGAAASTSGGFELEGKFGFDSELFDPAEINVEYKNNTWTIGGTIGIPPGKITGIKNATINASYSENNFTASGDVELDIPGIEKGSIDVRYGEDGFSIGGKFNLKGDIPGIKGGTVSAAVVKGEEGYKVNVSGTAQPDIPGINSEFSVTYDDGALTIQGEAAYSRGMLSGTIEVGATNRPIGEEGAPTGPPDETMRVFGGGSLTLRLTPWLEAKAGVKFTEQGQIEVVGRIGLPDSVDIFPRKSIDKNLFTAPTVEIPIFAIPLGPRSLGIVAGITGGLDFSAGFGPGQLRELFAEVTYNPEKEDETTIHGSGKFVIPADAGLTLRGDLGLGLSVGIASLSGGIEVAGTLGLEGEAAAGVDVNWSPQTGLVIDAEGSITVNPKFTFDINAFARASLDLWITSISRTWRYNLTSFNWGPDIQFGLIFPIHYKEDEPFDISFDDIEVKYPDLDIVEIASGLAKQVKNSIFD